MIDMHETAAQRDADRVREHAPMLLAALLYYRNECTGAEPSLSAFERMADEAIEYATGAHDPESYPEQGYDVDAAGTFTG